MPRSLFRVFLLGFDCKGITLHGNGQPEKAETGIREIMQNKCGGISVAVVKNNRIIYTHSFGLKDGESNTALTDDCLFRIASISKSFSAISIMQLVKQKNYRWMMISVTWSVSKSETLNTLKRSLRSGWSCHTALRSMTARGISHWMGSTRIRIRVGQNVIMTTNPEPRLVL